MSGVGTWGASSRDSIQGQQSGQTNFEGKFKGNWGKNEASPVPCPELGSAARGETCPWRRCSHGGGSGAGGAAPVEVRTGEEATVRSCLELTGAFTERWIGKETAPGWG